METPVYLRFLPLFFKFYFKAFSLVSLVIKVVPEIAKNKLPDILLLKTTTSKQTNKPETNLKNDEERCRDM